MKKIYALSLLAACAVMVPSCKNNNKEKEAAPAEAVENCCGAGDSEEGCAGCAGDGEMAGDCCAQDGAEAEAPADEDGSGLADAVQPYTSVEVKPMFDGGDAEDFVKYVQKNLKYPQSALENGDAGRVIVSFVVDTEGKVRDAKVLRGVTEALDAEALRVISNSPDWTPAKQDGKNVAVTYSIPVTFAIK